MQSAGAAIGEHHEIAGVLTALDSDLADDIRHLRIDDLPANLSEALDDLEKDELIRDTLGEHIFQHFLEAKREEWDDYIRHVSSWETERYLRVY